MSPKTTNAADSSVPPASPLWWVVPAAALVVIPLIGMFFGGKHEPESYGTSYDASEGGFRGVYLVLEELGYPVERSRRRMGGNIRWILFPSKTTQREAGSIGEWIQGGGVVLLALDNSEFGDQIGLSVKIRSATSSKNGKDFSPVTELPRRSKGEAHAADAPDVDNVFAGNLEVIGPSGGKIWGKIEGQPLVTIYQRGKGEIWLLNRSDVLTNTNVREGDNAILACRLAEAMLEKRSGSRISFDEYFHGLHDRPNVFQLLFRPPLLTSSLEVLLLTGLALWHFGVRFGSLRRAPHQARRSKEEFLKAMADLLARKGDRADAFRTVRDEFLRRLEKGLGLSAGTSVKKVVREAERRYGIESEPLLQLLTARTPPEGKSAGAFLDALHQLEIAANECFQSRSRSR
jgi:hypothetical protein